MWTHRFEDVCLLCLRKYCIPHCITSTKWIKIASGLIGPLSQNIRTADDLRQKPKKRLRAVFSPHLCLVCFVLSVCQCSKMWRLKDVMCWCNLFSLSLSVSLSLAQMWPSKKKKRLQCLSFVLFAAGAQSVCTTWEETFKVQHFQPGGQNSLKCRKWWERCPLVFQTAEKCIKQKTVYHRETMKWSCISMCSSVREYNVAFSNVVLNHWWFEYMC